MSVLKSALPPMATQLVAHQLFSVLMKLSTEALPSMKALQAFDLTVRLGSITAAARAMDSTQPALSQLIRSLEETLGDVLFERAGGRLTITTVGKRFHDEISPALKSIVDAAYRVRIGAIAGRRKISIAAHFGFAHL